MNHRRARLCRPSFMAVLMSAGLLVVVGCGKPNAANIQVRRENQDLRAKVDNLERRQQAYLAQIRAMESQATTVPVLPQARIEPLFTTHGLQIGRLTGSVDFNSKTPGEDGLKVYVVPTDASRQPIKAAGSFIVEAFDLAQGSDHRIGRWEFPLEGAAKHWVGRLMLYTYALECPWQTRPEHGEVTVRVTFTDALTGRTFTEQTMVKVQPPPPATMPDQ